MFRHKKVQSVLQEAEEKSWKRLLYLKNLEQQGCVFQDVEPPKYKSILRKVPKFLEPKHSVQFIPDKKKERERERENGKEKGGEKKEGRERRRKTTKKINECCNCRSFLQPLLS